MAAMSLAVFAGFALAWTVLGASGAFRPDSWEVSGLWVVIAVVLGLLAGVLGGIVCRWIAKGDAAALWVLIALTIVLAIPPIIGRSGSADPAPRPGDLPMFEAMASAEQPTYFPWLNPVLGIAGALVGWRLIRRSRKGNRL